MTRARQCFAIACIASSSVLAVPMIYVELNYRWGNRPARGRGEANAIGAGAGAAIQGALGIAFPVERWRRVWRDDR